MLHANSRSFLRVLTWDEWRTGSSIDTCLFLQMRHILKEMRELGWTSILFHTCCKVYWRQYLVNKWLADYKKWMKNSLFICTVDSHANFVVILFSNNAISVLYQKGLKLLTSWLAPTILNKNQTQHNKNACWYIIEKLKIFVISIWNRLQSFCIGVTLFSSFFISVSLTVLFSNCAYYRLRV